MALAVGKGHEIAEKPLGGDRFAVVAARRGECVQRGEAEPGVGIRAEQRTAAAAGVLDDTNLLAIQAQVRGERDAVARRQLTQRRDAQAVVRDMQHGVGQGDHDGFLLGLNGVAAPGMDVRVCWLFRRRLPAWEGPGPAARVRASREPGSVLDGFDGVHLEGVGVGFADSVVDAAEVDADVLGVVDGVVAVGAVDLVAAGEGERDAEPLFVGLEVEVVEELVEAVAADHFVLVLLDGVGAHLFDGGVVAGVGSAQRHLGVAV